MPMQNLDQFLFALQRVAQSESGIAQGVYLAGIFAVLLWRRESVSSWWLFRMSVLLYGGSLVVPAIVTPLMRPLIVAGPGYPPNDFSQIVCSIAIGAMWPALFAGAVICGVSSMLPRIAPWRSAPPFPGPHPLD